MLNNKHILITRPIHQAKNLQHLIESENGNAILFPTLAIQPIDFNKIDFLNFNKESDKINYAIFISANAVDFGLPILKNLNVENLKLICVGEGSKTALIHHEFYNFFDNNPILIPENQFDSDGILMLPELQSEKIQNKNVMIFKGIGGKKYLSEQLKLRLANVFTCSCYERINSQINDENLNMNYLDAVVISSSEGLINFWNILTENSKNILKNKPFFVIHKNIYKTAEILDIKNIIISETSDMGILNSLISYFK